VARPKRPPEPVVGAGDFPEWLRREVVVVGDFVASGEQPPSWWGASTAAYTDREWRQIRSLRRWQVVVAAWGVERGLSVRDLRRLGYWPTRPPLFARA
jgi:hypothetical protein